MQRDNERRRLTVPGTRTDNGDHCTLLLVQENGGTWALYPHGATQLGVRVALAAALTMARAIQGDAR